MSFDDKIKLELENESRIIDEILNDKQGMFDLAAGSFKSGLGTWMSLIYIVILIVSGLMLWTGYEFFIAGSLDDRMFWGVWFITSVIAQVGMKQWTWMEMNRSSLLREVKRVEIELTKLSSHIKRSELQ